MFREHVEKMKKTKHVRTPDRRSDANLSRGMYRPLDQRKYGDEPVLSRVLNRKRRNNDVREVTVEDYPASEYQRMYES